MNRKNIIARRTSILTSTTGLHVVMRFVYRTNYGNRARSGKKDKAMYMFQQISIQCILYCYIQNINGINLFPSF